MRKLKNISGKKFNRLTVIKIVKRNKSGNVMWLCKCDCGNTKVINGSYLRSGHTKSCGCLQKEIISKINNTHNMTGSGEYKSWTEMKQRCFNKKNCHYKWYGKRNITVCDRWKNSFINFYKDMGERPREKTLDRIDNNGDYKPNNCQWSTQTEQCRNRRDNRLFVFRGKEVCMTEIAEILNVNPKSLYSRIYRSDNLEKTIKDLERGWQ